MTNISADYLLFITISATEFSIVDEIYCRQGVFWMYLTFPFVIFVWRTFNLYVFLTFDLM